MQVDPNFDRMCANFTKAMEIAADWKHYYLGAAYATRLRSAIADVKKAVAEAEKSVEIGGESERTTQS